MERYSATIEILRGARAAIVELTDARGEWAGGSRIDLPRAAGASAAELYERGYQHAARAAAVKAGELGRFSRSVPPRPPRPAPGTARGPDGTEHADCRYAARSGLVLPRRRANGLNIEVGTPAPRCLLKLPDHWRGPGASAIRWLASGGSALVFGHCTPNACHRKADR
jgi:hypothetical protein